MWNISLPDFSIQYVILSKGGIHTMYWVKWKMTILFITYREKGCFKDYYVYIYIHIYMYNIFPNIFPTKQCNNMLCLGTVNLPFGFA